MQKRLLLKGKKAQVLIAAIAVIVMLGLFGVVSISLFGTQTGQSAIGFVESTQAFYIAHAGLEWYLQQLCSDDDWTDQSNQTKAFANGSFAIEVSNLASTSIDIKSIGQVLGPDGRNRERYVSVTARKMPTAFQFAVFWGRDNGSTLELDGSTVSGDFWSRGDLDVQSDSSISGVSYCPDTQDVSGGGSFNESQIAAPYLDMPQIDETYYNNLINTFDNYIDDYGTNSSITQSSSLVLNGNIIGCRNFTTKGDITISGHGYIVADRDIDLHTSIFSTGTLTITPSGGNIYILAGRSLTVGATLWGTYVNMNPGVYLYSGAESTSHLIEIREAWLSSSTKIDSAFILGKRRIIVENGAEVTNSTLYVSDVSDTNNYLEITDSDTTVSGSIISVSGRDPGLIIDNDASVSGVVYYWGDTSGSAEIGEATITGSLVASEYRKDSIDDSTITYDINSILDNLPEGFEDSVSVEPNSWDSL